MRQTDKNNFPAQGVRKWIPTWSNEPKKKFQPRSQGVNPHTKQRARKKDFSSPVGTFQTKKPGPLIHLQRILRILRIKICLYCASVDCHSDHWFRRQTDNGFLMNQPGVKTKASKVHIWGPWWEVLGSNGESDFIQVMTPQLFKKTRAGLW